FDVGGAVAVEHRLARAVLGAAVRGDREGGGRTRDGDVVVAAGGLREGDVLEGDDDLVVQIPGEIVTSEGATVVGGRAGRRGRERDHAERQRDRGQPGEELLQHGGSSC